ncbi:MAG: Fic family protein [Patescibacteria group bacterium]|jgi:Fic family protein
MKKIPLILNKRQENILDLLSGGKPLKISGIISGLKTAYSGTSKITINRDLKTLIASGYVIKKGKARATVYEFSSSYNLLRSVEVKKYFSVPADKREAKEKFDFNIFSLLKNIFTGEEEKYLYSLNGEYRDNLKRISPAIAKNELERLIIELSWKSSRIEGNTYSLLETEVLIKEKKEAKGHNKEEAIMILNHKETLDYIINNKKIFNNVSTAKIEDIHYLLTKNLGIAKNLRKSAVGIVGTKYRPLDNQHEIREAMGKACGVINREKNHFAKALVLSLLIAYIQPFEDGNKRTSRLSANAVLLANNICLLSYRNVDEVEYKKAVILFYEQNNLSYFKRLFIEQSEFAVKNYFKA